MFDERFVKHRYKSTSHAAMVAAVMLFGFFVYNLLAHDLYRWDMAMTLGAMTVTKLVATAYYRRTD